MKKLILFIALLASCVIMYAKDCYVVDARVLNVRNAPNSSSSIIGALQKGDSVYTESSPSAGWLKITYNGGVGYVRIPFQI